MARAKPAIGWFMLSEADRDSAQRFLSDLSSDGTRDELGFAPIHFSFADRFFPGTSVQHAQLRYVFFVAWAYQEILEESAGGRFERDRLSEIEYRYSKRLMSTIGELRNSGISGWMKYQSNERPVVRASTVYWSALRSWRIANPIAGIPSAPTEAQLQRLWPKLLSWDEGDAQKTSKAILFDDIPRPPDSWRRKTGQLSFELRPQEAEYIRRKWRTAGEAGTQPLLSKLSESGTTTGSLWSLEVRRIASPEERELLHIAKCAASVACVARAAYAALIEKKRNSDNKADERQHADALPQLVLGHRDAALALNINDLRTATRIDDRLTCFVRDVVQWVREGGQIDGISRALVSRERDLKGERAYLLNKKRRNEWQKEIAKPLDYRWPIVCEMIRRVGG